MIDLNLPNYQFNIKSQNGIPTIFCDLRKKWVKLTPEEWVRQNFTRFLVSELQYPLGVMGHEIALSINGRSRRCDTLIYNTQGNPCVVIEYKAPHINITQNTFDQVIRYNLLLQVPYIFVSNGLSHFCYSLNEKEHKFILLPTIPTYNEVINRELSI